MEAVTWVYVSKFIELYIKRKLTEFKLYLNETSLEKKSAN